MNGTGLTRRNDMKEYRIRHHFDWEWFEGGFTIVIDPVRKAIGIAVCSPHDQYSRKTGVRIAKQRLEMLDVARPGTDEKLTLVGIMAPRIHGPKDWMLKTAISEAIDEAYRHFPELDSVMIIMQPEAE